MRRRSEGRSKTRCPFGFKKKIRAVYAPCTRLKSVPASLLLCAGKRFIVSHSILYDQVTRLAMKSSTTLLLAVAIAICFSGALAHAGITYYAMWSNPDCLGPPSTVNYWNSIIPGDADHNCSSVSGTYVPEWYSSLDQQCC